MLILAAVSLHKFCSAGASEMAWTPGRVSSDCEPIVNLNKTSKRVAVNLHFQFSGMHMQMSMTWKLEEENGGLLCFYISNSLLAPPSSIFSPAFTSAARNELTHLPLKHNK